MKTFGKKVKVYTAAATCELPTVLCGLLSGESLNKRLIFCEDKFTLALELALAKNFGGSFGTQVFSFNRFMHSRLPESGRPVSIEGSALIVKRVLLENKKRLECFKNVYEPNLSAAVYELIAQLKSAKVTPKELSRAEEQSSGNLKRKLKDLALIYSEYEKYLKDSGLTDGNNRLYLLPEFIKNSEEIKNAEVFVVGFSALNKTLCEIFSALNFSAKSLSFVIAHGENERVYTNELYDFLRGKFDFELVKKEEDAKKYLLSALYNPIFKSEEKSGLKGKKLYFYRAQNRYEEIEHVARIIKSRVIKGEKFKSFALAVENPAEYSLIVRRVFGDYGIPCFIDETSDLSKHPLALLIKSLLEFTRKKTPESFIAIIENPVFLPDKSFADRLENYVIKNAFSRRAIASPFVIFDEELERFEQIRGAIGRLSALFDLKTLTFYSAIESVKKALEFIDAEKSVEALGENLSKVSKGELAAYNAQAYEKFIGVLSEAQALLGDKPANLIEVSSVIASGLLSCKLSLIPEFNDCVFVGDFRAVKYKEYKKLFLAGLTAAVPQAKADCALLCDKDLKKLDEISVFVEPKIRQVNRRSRENACFAAAAFSEELFLSYPVWTKDGASADYSEILGGALLAYGATEKNIADFKVVAIETERAETERKAELLSLGYLSPRAARFSLARGINDYSEGKKSDFSAESAYLSICEEANKAAEKASKKANNGENADENDEENAKIASKKSGIESGESEAEVELKMLDKANSSETYYSEGTDYIKNGASATAIESFFSCPYSCFLERGLKLKEREKNDLAAVDLGTLVHFVAERFGEELKNQKITDENVAKIRGGEIFEEVSASEEYARYKLSARGKRVFALVKKEAVRFCTDMYKGCAASAFKPTLIEAEFGRGKYPPLKINTRRGELKISGKIDRVDVFEDKMRVVDYKTGGVVSGDIDENLYSGNKLQLFLYAGALTDKYKPAGVYYFPISDNFVKEGESRVLKLRGRTLADEKVIGQLDEGKISGGEEFIDAKLTVKDGVVKETKDFLTERDFDNYIEYSRRVAAEGLAEMKEGVIIPSPYGEKCAYCKFAGVCGYDEETQCRRREVSADKEDIAAALEYENSLNGGKNDKKIGENDNEKNEGGKN